MWMKLRLIGRCERKWSLSHKLLFLQYFRRKHSVNVAQSWQWFLPRDAFPVQRNERLFVANESVDFLWTADSVARHLHFLSRTSWKRFLRRDRRNSVCDVCVSRVFSCNIRLLTFPCFPCSMHTSCRWRSSDVIFTAHNFRHRLQRHQSVNVVKRLWRQRFLQRCDVISTCTCDVTSFLRLGNFADASEVDETSVATLVDERVDHVNVATHRT